MTSFYVEHVDSTDVLNIRKRVESASCRAKAEASAGCGVEDPGRFVDVQEIVASDDRTGPIFFGAASCTIKPGLCHPWRRYPISTTTYVSDTSKRSHSAPRDIQHGQYAQIGTRKITIFPKGAVFA